jgi:hypothetical protein
MVDTNIKRVAIPINEIDSVHQDGTIELRYRISSKDKNRNSHWSKIYKVDPGVSFSELSGYLFPTLEDNHPSSAVVHALYPSSSYMQSRIVRNGVGGDVFTYTWTPKSNGATTRNFDVYISWKTPTAWQDWEFVGTTSSNSFSFQRPDGNTSYQFVQAAVTVSAFPKLTNIGDNSGANIFLSLSPILYIFYSATGTVASAAGPTNGFYTATVSSLSTGFQSLSSSNNNNGIAITATPGTGSFGTGQVTVTDRPTSTSITVRSNSPFTNGTVIDIKA